MKAYKALALPLLALALVGCGGDSPEALIQDLKQAFTTNDFELLESRVDVEGVVEGLGSSYRAAVREQMGDGNLAAMARSQLDRQINGLMDEMRKGYAESKENLDFGDLRDDVKVESYNLEEVGSATSLRVHFLNGDDQLVVYFPLVRRDNRWMVTGMERLTFR